MAPSSKLDPPEDVELALLNPPAESDEGLEKSEHDFKKPNYLVGKNAKAISACTLYSFCSVIMVLVNKSLASR
jgi:hypothetical protein